MPNDTEMAASNDMCGAPFSAPANTTPTAMPSGRLCMVTFNAEFFTVATRFILLFYVYACKAYYIYLLLPNFSIKKLLNTFAFNVYLQLYIVCLHLFTNIYMIIYIFIYGRFLVLVVLLSGAGGASLVVRGVLRGIYATDKPRRAHARLLSAAVSLACESKLQGKSYECDCSNYLLFMCPSWDSFYWSVFQLSH